ncbi:SRPBCC family protein [Kitasatospora sp. NPDC096128]|uniref:SRPBCC family protein n=1 Tax=Kitasatospora sp. NPDC096128 TaxID=3155547 RepID=UPI003320F3A3
MPKTTVSTLVEAPADDVWGLIRDFNGLGDWHPHMPPSRIEGGGPADAVGAVRIFSIGGTEIRETLLAFDEEGRSYTFSLPDGVFPLRNYRASLRVLPVTELNGSFVEWSATYDVEAAAERDMAESARGVFSAGLAALRARFAR